MISLQKNNKDNIRKNTTKYGEFVCTEYQWLPLEKQKEQAEKIALQEKEIAKNEEKVCANCGALLTEVYKNKVENWSKYFIYVRLLTAYDI